jgi:hypothetical protein
MIVTANDARELIRSAYGADFKFKILSKSVTLGVRPVYDPAPSLAWIRLCPGADSAVKIGELSRDGYINWSWEPT